MKKTISIMTISLLTATTLATASPSDQMDFFTLNKNDAHMLFQNIDTTTQHIVVLNENQMNKLKARNWEISQAMRNAMKILTRAISMYPCVKLNNGYVVCPKSPH